ncbi:MAG: hypothetical protein Q4P30_02310 [Eubacteriales bacterium]|nr:hypothetical protein [Eubacteriales bacterium]
MRGKKRWLMPALIAVMAVVFLFVKRGGEEASTVDRQPARTQTVSGVDTETFLAGMRTAGCRVMPLAHAELTKAVAGEPVRAYRITGGSGYETLVAHLWIYPNRHVAAEAFTMLTGMSVSSEDGFVDLPASTDRENLVYISGDAVLVVNTDTVRKNRAIALMEENGFMIHKTETE